MVNLMAERWCGRSFVNRSNSNDLGWRYISIGFRDTEIYQAMSWRIVWLRRLASLSSQSVRGLRSSLRPLAFTTKEI